MILSLLVACLTTTSAPDDSVVDTDTAADVDDTEVEDDDPWADLYAIHPEDLPAGPYPCREPEIVWVSWIVDGDTMWVDSSRGDEKIRFIGVDTAEIGYDGDADECWAEEAKTFATEQLLDRPVWLSFDYTCTDYYDRTLAYIHTDLGQDGFFERVMLREGWAQTLTIAPNDSFEDVFKEDQSAARESGEGGWDGCWN